MSSQDSIRSSLRSPFIQNTLPVLVAIGLLFGWMYDEISQIRRDIADIRNMVTELQTSGAVLESRFTALEQRFGMLEQGVAALNQRVGMLEQGVATLGSTVETLSSTVDRIENHQLPNIEKAILENTKSLISLQYSVTKPTPGLPRQFPIISLLRGDLIPLPVTMLIPAANVS